MNCTISSAEEIKAVVSNLDHQPLRIIINRDSNQVTSGPESKHGPQGSDALRQIE